MSDSILSTNSRERSRQIENIRRVRGGEVEKKILFNGRCRRKKKRQEQILKEREKKSSRSDVLKGRLTGFVPCNKTMKSHLMIRCIDYKSLF